MTLLTSLAAQLRTQRQAHHLTQQQVATDAQVSRTTVYLIEAGGDAKLSTIASLAKATHCTVEIILVPERLAL